MLEPPQCTRKHANDSARPAERVLLVGGRRQVRHLAQRTRTLANWSRLPFVGFVDRSGRNRQIVVHPGSQPVPALGKLDHLSDVVSRSGATDLVVAARGSRARHLRGQLGALAASGFNVRIHWVGENDSAMATLSQTAQAATSFPWSLLWQRAAKRSLDILGAGLGLLVLSPLLALVALAVLLSSGRPIFYTQERVGAHGRRFRIWKFRSMRTNAEDSTGPIWAEDHDRRCTRIGDWMRHTNIDELPQLWNVLIGDMSLVGPRPERPCFVDAFNAEHADYDLRHAVPVGLTGWAQVHGWRGKTSLRKRIQYDLDYIDHWSIWLDLKTLLMTVEHVLWGKTSWAPRKPEKS